VVISEPLSKESPYYPLCGALLSPHIAGPTLDDCLLCGERARQNILRYLNGQRPDGVLSLAAYDRMT
jgi:phosphoglycerate dehydrogenase-like enzyme